MSWNLLMDIEQISGLRYSPSKKLLEDYDEKKKMRKDFLVIPHRVFILFVIRSVFEK